MSATAFKAEFTARVRLARGSRTQEEMADLLGIKQDKYKQYEKRSLMPHYLIPAFCRACGVDPAWLFTGAGRGPMALPPKRPAA